ncbi:hypothetical protein FACS1894200_05360 [Spirochaetia bacterium]|nr:hypothetical protein FACS1894200_05360 [Spirochaetia bacterium]
MTASFNRLSDEKQSEILGIAEAFIFTQRGVNSDLLTVMHDILGEPLTGDVGKDTGED